MLGYTNILPSPHDIAIAQNLRSHMTSWTQRLIDTLKPGNDKPLKGGGGIIHQSFLNVAPMNPYGHTHTHLNQLKLASYESFDRLDKI